MKKLLTGFFVAVLSLTVAVNAEANEDATKEELNAPAIQTTKSDATFSKQDRATMSGGVTGPASNTTYYTISKTLNTATEFAWTQKAKDGSYAYTSYYKKIDNKWVNHRYDYSYKYSDNSSYKYNYYLAYNTNNCSTGSSTNGTKYNCVTLYNGSPVKSKDAYTRLAANGKLSAYRYSIYSVSSKNHATYQDSRYYHSNGKLASQALTWRNAAGSMTKSRDNYYDTRARLTQRTDRNAKSYRTYHERINYYSNNKIKERYIGKYNPNVSMRHTKGYYAKFRSNGKKQVYKKMYYNKSGRLTRMDSTTYNKAGQTKSNKYGKAYKYKTYMKGYSIKKVTKAKYSKKGKLGKAKKIKPTTFTRTYYQY